MILPIFTAHIASESFNLTSFSVISDPSGYETIEWDDEGEYAGGGTLDRVVVNNWPEIYVRIYTSGVKVTELAIMNGNDILLTKYIAVLPSSDIEIDYQPVGNSLHIVIENVTKHMGTTLDDAEMITDETIITIGSYFEPLSYGTWTSTIKPDNPKMELDCKVVSNSNSIVTAKCDSKTTWSKSVFNRIPILVSGGASFGYNSRTNNILFGKASFSIDGSVPSSWNESIRYDVTGSGSNLIIGNQLTIMGLPESFVSHWVDMGAKALMGKRRVMLVPPDSS